MSTIESTADNGVDLDALRGTRAAMAATPAAAAFQWRATCRWVDGANSRTTVERFFGLGDEHAHRHRFVLDTDHPEMLAAEGNGPTPYELVLAGLAGCLTAGMASAAQDRGVQLHAITATLRGDMDLRGTLGIEPGVRNGFDRIRVRLEIEADADDDVIRAIVRQAQDRSAVHDIVANPTAVTVDVAGPGGG